ncbi:F-box DNA helicase 1 [Brachionichthys hirsutus]|uniref:F-box DNA helicase 1 n=1 Tax=Brachionichthys hirsutus TaxID=412623 RepID=UPI003605358B
MESTLVHPTATESTFAPDPATLVANKRKVKRRHPNTVQCAMLGLSAEGGGALTHPQSLNHGRGKRDPNAGLYPRTPTKRRKCASTSGSPSVGQKAIDEYFSVTGVVTSSPRKSAQPSASAGTNRVRGELFPRDAPENDDDDDDDDEDVSLLDAGTKVDVTDDVLLIAAAEESDSAPDGTTDYLEGMTAEMFGDVDEFDPDVHSEEESEALPDARDGLLGGGGGGGGEPLQPQGCIDDLPDEVLSQILCEMPAQDLYRGAGLVCHRWRDIVQDPQFVPFKKRYYRYMMREEAAVREVFSILRESLVISPASSEHSLRQLVVLMAQHKERERVRPEHVLERVRAHRLFPMAEASIRLRIPDVQKNFSLGVEGPNPYAAMAVILLLSESVEDVEVLVSLLAGCMSRTAVTEYLSHMATMLLALKWNSVQISSRLHYNIYYVLHLMENGPFAVTSAHSRRPQIRLTREQQQILSHDILEDHVVKIVAFAGTGKTTTLVKYAEQWPHLRFLYVAFNRSVATEAQRRFPKNVVCKTVHSLAFSEIGKSYQIHQKLTFGIKPFALNSVLPKGRGGYAKAKVVATTLNAFMASTDRTIGIRHVPGYRVSTKDQPEPIDEKEKPLFVSDAQKIWNKMKDLNAKEHDAFHMTHDGYLKLWQLRSPKPNLSEQYDVLFIDEAQDCTPAILDILLPQRCGKILVGDPHQQIYTFRGAVNALNLVGHTHIYYLTQSFRFGSEIAYVGSTILTVCKKVEKILVGGKQQGGVCNETAEGVMADIRTGVSRCRGKTAILSRCNVSVFNEAVRVIDANARCRLHFIGGVESIGLNRILDIWHLMPDSRTSKEQGQKPRYIKDPFIRAFAKKTDHSFWALKTYVTQTEDKELEAKLRIVEAYRGRIPELVTRLESCYENDMNNADFIMGTVHKAKGLEFDTVMVTNDFTKFPCARHNQEFSPNFSFDKVPEDEWNLLYVAVTRARTTLIITKAIHHILTMAGDYPFKSQMPSPLMKAGEPLPCKVKDCPNCITPGSAFIICKKTMKYTDGVSAGGPLCERCVWTHVGPIAFLMADDVLSMAQIPGRFAPPIDHMMFLPFF